VLLVGIADEPRRIIGVETGKTLENQLQAAKMVIAQQLEYDRDIVSFEQVEVEFEGATRMCLVIVVAQACQVVGVDDGDGRFTYPERLETGKRRSSRLDIGSKKTFIKSDNFDFIDQLVQFVREH